ncbi:HIT family protein [Halalkalibacter alkaliphilus]|uniref:HIT domain-containing protein n=1 Tax=Halalkalibacter alkaliphilus TaxID=2917993 RepID=A0A9X2CTU7_9BACI|nr:HIT domain-containing protein [Halalkalibacter alkaliphilus]
MSQCPICEKHEKKKDVLFENENWVITHGPLGSQLLGYVYLEPKRHVENWSDFSETELVELGPLIKKIELSLKELIHLDRLYSVTISEAVRHIHFHLIPRGNTTFVRGIPLIEQATQQKALNENEIEQVELETFKEKFKSTLLL